MLAEQGLDQRAVVDAPPHEDVAVVLANRPEGVEVAGVGELIQVDDPVSPLGDSPSDEAAPDEAGTSGDEEIRCHRASPLGGFLATADHNGARAILLRTERNCVNSSNPEFACSRTQAYALHVRRTGQTVY